MGLWQRKRPDACQPVGTHSCAIPYIVLTFPVIRSYLLECNSYAIAELTQSIFKRQNPRKLCLIHYILYSQ